MVHASSAKAAGVEVHAEFVVASAKVLDEGISRADDSC